MDDEKRTREKDIDALRDLQRAFDGAAEEAGLVDEDDVTKAVREYREERFRE